MKKLPDGFNSFVENLLKEVAGGGNVTGDTTTLEDLSVLAKLGKADE